MRARSLLEDPGVLDEGAVYEFQHSVAVGLRGGTAVLPWRDAWLRTRAKGIDCVALAEDLPATPRRQCVVHLQKGRAATRADLAAAWVRLAPGGSLLLSGPNTLGIASLCKRLGRELGQTPEVRSNRSRARVVRFERDAGPGPVPETTPAFTLPDGRELETAPGVFSARRLDTGTAQLLASLAERPTPARVLDLGCGAGVLAIGALGLWPEARALAVDADARAVRCASRNLARLGLSERCEVAWWDAHEPPLGGPFELVLVNPPFHHRGVEVDLGPAQAMFRSLPAWLGPRGEALLVANRFLPYERLLRDLGELRVLSQGSGYKLLSFRSLPRSSGPSRRSSPGARSAGSS